MATHVLNISISVAELACTTVLSSGPIVVQVRYEDGNADALSIPPFDPHNVALAPPLDAPENDNAGRVANRLIVYWCGCDGLCDLYRRLGFPQIKIGSLVACSLDDRFAGLGSSRYGAALRDPADPTTFIQEPGFDEWRLVENRATDFKNIPLPAGVRIENGVFVIDLAPGVDPWAVDGYMRTTLATRETRAWAHSAEGRAACARAGVTPDTLSRYSCDPATGVYTPTTEIYALHCRRDREFFVAILRDAIAWASSRVAA